MAKKRTECDVVMTVCLSKEANEAVETYQAFIKRNKKKASYNKDQTINAMLLEWAEDRNLILEVTKKK